MAGRLIRLDPTVRVAMRAQQVRKDRLYDRSNE